MYRKIEYPSITEAYKSLKRIFHYRTDHNYTKTPRDRNFISLDEIKAEREKMRERVANYRLAEPSKGLQKILRHFR